MSHETRDCRERMGRQQRLPEPPTHRLEEDDRHRLNAAKDGGARQQGPRGRESKRVGGKRSERASPKLLRWDLMEELGEAVEERKVPKISTQEWVRKSFGRGEPKEPRVKPRERLPEKEPAPQDVSDEPIANWYRKTVDDADLARAVYDQNDKWEQEESSAREKEKTLRRPAQVAAERKPAAEKEGDEVRLSAGLRGTGPTREMRANGPKIVVGSDGSQLEEIKGGPKSVKDTLGPKVEGKKGGLSFEEKNDGQAIGRKKDGPKSFGFEAGPAHEKIIYLEAHDIISPLKDILGRLRKGRKIR